MRNPIALRSVRAKLAALVGLSSVLALIAVPVQWLTFRADHLRMVEERGSDANSTIRRDFDDDATDLAVTVASAASAWRLGNSLEAVERAVSSSRKYYPEHHVFLVSTSGAVMASYGGDGPHPTTMDRPPTSGAAFEPCAGRGSVSTRAVEDVAEKGWVVGCIAVDPARLDDESKKLGFELAIVNLDGTIGDRSSRFPIPKGNRAVTSTDLVEYDGRSWAIARLEPSGSEHGLPLRLAAASDVTAERDRLVWGVGRTFAILLTAAVITFLIGGRLARTMSRALGEISNAFRTLARQEYVHVENVETGDELEDLARGFNTMVEGLKERDNLRVTFGKYMTASLADHILRGEVKLGGETLRATILFTDIRGFTTLSEHMEPQALVALLNEYFTRMVAIILEEGGVVDKYVGDAIMAVFGAPIPDPADADRAVRSAIRMRASLAELNESLAERGLPRIETGIGIHTGDVVAGNIGSEQRMEYTVIGDAVNVASRLEGMTKSVGAPIIVSAETESALRQSVALRRVGEVQVRGRTEPLSVFAIDG